MLTLDSDSEVTGRSTCAKMVSTKGLSTVGTSANRGALCFSTVNPAELGRTQGFVSGNHSRMRISIQINMDRSSGYASGYVVVARFGVV